jgi:hypothetical protein
MRSREVAIRHSIPAGTIAPSLTDARWQAFASSAVIASAAGKTPAGEARRVAIALPASRLTDEPWQAWPVGLYGVLLRRLEQ